MKNLPAVRETQVWSLGQEDALEKEMATHSNIFAWELPRTEEPGELQSMVAKSQTQLSDWRHHTLAYEITHLIKANHAMFLGALSHLLRQTTLSAERVSL